MSLREETWRDIRFAARMLRKDLGFATVAVLTLALGIGANTAIFSVVHAVLLRALPYTDPDRLIVVSSDAMDPASGVPLETYDALQSDAVGLAGAAVYYRNGGWSRVTLTTGDGGGEPESAEGAFVSGTFFPLMGVRPLLGRWLTPEDDRGGERVVVLSHGLWSRRFGGAASAIGRTLRVDSTDLRVIGVMPPEFQFPERAAQFWAPLSVNRFWHDESAGLFSPTRSLGFYRRWNIVARLNELPDRAPARGRVQARLSTIAQRLEAADPRRHAGLRLHALPLRVQPERSATRALLVLFGAVCFVLLIACTNLANLLLARGKARERELALRSALGAERGQLIRQLLMESLILALAGAVAGLLIGAAGLRALVSFGPPDLPRLEQARIDGWIVTFTCGVSVLSAALFGLAPAWALSRRDPAEALRSGGRGGGGAGLRGMRQALVVTELALALLLLTGAGLLMRSLLEIKSVDPGYRPERVLTLQIGLPSTAPPARRAELVTQALGRLTALPGVEAAGTVNGLFELGGATSLGLRDVEGHEPEPRSRWTPLTWKTVGGEYFKAMQIALLRGRTFDVRDGAGAPLVAVIDESTARRYWPGENPIGKRFKGQDRRGESDEWLTVIGLVRDTRRQGLDRTPAPTIYQWSRQSGDATPDLVVRTSGDVRATAATVRATIRAIDASAIVSAVTLLEAELGRQLAPRRFQTWLLGAFSMLAMVLAMVGLYGVIHFMVAQRTREIGIRIALGADPRRVLGTVLGEGARLAAIGIGAGTLGAWWLTALLADLLFGVRPGDPLTFAVSAAALMAVALAACAVPAVRAMRVNPVVALRDDR